jgi:hypothetical protein
MVNLNLKIFANLISFNLIWTLSVFLGNSALPWVLLLLIIHFIIISEPLIELKIVTATALLGYSIDCLLTLSGFFKFDQVQGITPIWLAFLWLGFSSTLGHSLSFFAGKPLLCSIFGAVSGGLTYIAAAHFNAVELEHSISVSFVALAAIWALLFPALVSLDYSLRKKLC